MELYVGARVKDYVLERQLGTGASGEVWKASDDTKTVAIKFMNENLKTSPAAQKHRQRLEREIDALRRLQHPNIPTLYDYDLEFERPYITMRYIGGDSYEKLIANGEMLRIPLARRTELIMELSRALYAAHHAGIIHRDIKPANITGTETPYLLDFSVALPSESLMATKADIGTALYMAPDGIPSKLGDIFGFTLVSYEIIFGRHPIIGPEDSKARGMYATFVIGERIKSREWRFPSRVPPEELPPDLIGIDLERLDAIFEKGLGDQSKRYQDPREFARDLRSTLLREQPIPAPLRPVAPPSSPTPPPVYTPPAEAKEKALPAEADNKNTLLEEPSNVGTQLEADPHTPKAAPPEAPPLAKEQAANIEATQYVPIVQPTTPPATPPSIPAARPHLDQNTVLESDPAIPVVQPPSPPQLRMEDIVTGSIPIPVQANSFTDLDAGAPRHEGNRSLLVIGAVVAVIVIVGAILLIAFGGGGGTPAATATQISAGNTPVNTPAEASPAPTEDNLAAGGASAQETATSTPTLNSPTATRRPSSTPTNTPIPPTDTPIPPTDTPLPTSTDTPSATVPPTLTPLPTLTNTPTPQPSATVTLRPTNTLTGTPIPPTITPQPSDTVVAIAASRTPTTQPTATLRATSTLRSAATAIPPTEVGILLTENLNENLRTLLGVIDADNYGCADFNRIYQYIDDRTGETDTDYEIYGPDILDAMDSIYNGFCEARNTNGQQLPTRYESDNDDLVQVAVDIIREIEA